MVELEKVQGKAMKRIWGWKLNDLWSFFSLERRQVRGDMIEMYKIMHSVNKLGSSFSPSQNIKPPYEIKNPTDKRNIGICFGIHSSHEIWCQLPVQLASKKR